MKTHTLRILILLLVAAGAVAAEEKIVIGGLDGLQMDHHRQRYPVLLALSGGGARGLTVVGILRAFEEKGIEVKAVAGTSIGGIIGGLYASGYTPDELSEIVTDLDFNAFFSNSPSRTSMLLTRRQERDRHLLSIRFDGLRPVIPRGLTAGQKLTSLITELTTKASYQSGAEFSRLSIPFKTICTDIVSGQEVVLDSGSIADAMRATMAFPLAFTGLEDENRVLMDGGMVTPIPVALVKGMENSKYPVVAINTASRLLPKEELITPVDIANQVTSIMTADQLAEQLKQADFVINPPIDDFVSSDFKHKDSLIAIGYSSGLKAADSIIELISRESSSVEYPIGQVTVSGLTPEGQGIIHDRLHGLTLTRRQLEAELKLLALELGLFRIEADISQLTPDSSRMRSVALAVDAVDCLPYEQTEVVFNGNTIFDDATLRGHLIASDKQITPQKLKAGLKRIEQLYHDSGFDLSHVKDVRIDPQCRTIEIDIDQAVIERIDVENNVKTRDWYVRSYFPLEAGEPYSTTKADEGISNIYGTDLFDRVTVEVRPSDEGAVVKIGVEEKQSRQFRLGWHWHDEYRSEEFVEFLDDNVGGIGLQYILHARYAPDRQNYHASFKTDRILSSYLTGRVTVFHRRIDRQLYVNDSDEDGVRRELKTGFNLVLGQQIARLGTVSATLTSEHVKYDEPDSDIERKFDLRTLTFESLLENFDQIPFPTRGSRHTFQISLAGKLLGGDEEFTRFYASFEGYFPITRYLNYHPRLAIGISRSGLPPSEQFYLGGLHSFVGFRTHQLAGDKMFIFSSEVRFKLPLLLYLTARHDMGEVYVSSDQIKLRNLRHGVGAALAFDSPIGPFEFGYGIVNSDIDRFYVNIGLDF